MSELFISPAGNVVEIEKRENGKIFFNRVGYIDSEGESHELADGRWAVIPDECFAGFTPAVRMMGGNFMSEEEYVDIETVRTENKVEAFGHAIGRKRDTLNAY